MTINRPGAFSFPQPPFLFSFSNILHPFEVPAVLKVRLIALPGIRLTLERYVPVCRVCVPVHHQPYKPFHHIPQIEEHVQHLLHLRRVYFLVVDVCTAYHCVTPYEQDAEQVYSLVSLEGDDVVPYYLHTLTPINN